MKAERNHSMHQCKPHSQLNSDYQQGLQFSNPDNRKLPSSSEHKTGNKNSVCSAHLNKLTLLLNNYGSNPNGTTAHSNTSTFSSSINNNNINNQNNNLTSSYKKIISKTKSNGKNIFQQNQQQEQIQENNPNIQNLQISNSQKHQRDPLSIINIENNPVHNLDNDTLQGEPERQYFNNNNQELKIHHDNEFIKNEQFNINNHCNKPPISTKTPSRESSVVAGNKKYSHQQKMNKVEKLSEILNNNNNYESYNKPRFNNQQKAEKQAQQYDYNQQGKQRKLNLPMENDEGLSATNTNNNMTNTTTTSSNSMTQFFTPYNSQRRQNIDDNSNNNNGTGHSKNANEDRRKEREDKYFFAQDIEIDNSQKNSQKRRKSIKNNNNYTKNNINSFSSSQEISSQNLTNSNFKSLKKLMDQENDKINQEIQKLSKFEESSQNKQYITLDQYEFDNIKIIDNDDDIQKNVNDNDNNKDDDEEEEDNDHDDDADKKILVKKKSNPKCLSDLEFFKNSKQKNNCNPYQNTQPNLKKEELQNIHPTSDRPDKNNSSSSITLPSQLVNKYGILLENNDIIQNNHNNNKMKSEKQNDILLSKDYNSILSKTQSITSNSYQHCFLDKKQQTVGKIFNTRVQPQLEEQDKQNTVVGECLAKFQNKTTKGTSSKTILINTNTKIDVNNTINNFQSSMIGNKNKDGGSSNINNKDSQLIIGSVSSQRMKENIYQAQEGRISSQKQQQQQQQQYQQQQQQKQKQQQYLPVYQQQQQQSLVLQNQAQQYQMEDLKFQSRRELEILDMKNALLKTEIEKKSIEKYCRDLELEQKELQRVEQMNQSLRNELKLKNQLVEQIENNIQNISSSKQEGVLKFTKQVNQLEQSLPQSQEQIRNLDLLNKQQSEKLKSNEEKILSQEENIQNLRREIIEQKSMINNYKELDVKIQTLDLFQNQLLQENEVLRNKVQQNNPNFVIEFIKQTQDMDSKLHGEMKEMVSLFQKIQRMTIHILNNEEPSLECLVGHQKKKEKNNPKNQSQLIQQMLSPQQQLDKENLEIIRMLETSQEEKVYSISILKELKEQMKKLIDDLTETYLNNLGRQCSYTNQKIDENKLLLQ